MTYAICAVAAALMAIATQGWAKLFFMCSVIALVITAVFHA